MNKELIKKHLINIIEEQPQYTIFNSPELRREIKRRCKQNPTAETIRLINLWEYKTFIHKPNGKFMSFMFVKRKSQTKKQKQ